MKDIHEIRRENFSQLVIKLLGPREAALKLNMNESQVSQLTSLKTLKNLGNNLVKKIEKAASLEPGALDMPISVIGKIPIRVPIIKDLDFDGDISSQEIGALPSQADWPCAIWDHTTAYEPKGTLFAYYATDDSLDLLCEEGNLVVFDNWPQQGAAIQSKLKPGLIVIHWDGREFAIRVLKQAAAGGWDLVPTNQFFASKHIESQDGIIGVLVEARRFQPKAKS